MADSETHCIHVQKKPLEVVHPPIQMVYFQAWVDQDYAKTLNDYPRDR